MKRTLLSFFILAAVVIVFNGCSRDFSAMDSRVDDPSTFVQLSKSAQEVVASANAFSFNLFEETCRQEGEKNIFISPLSASMALTMVYNGAHGVTEQEMRTLLGFNDLTMSEINESCKTLHDILIALDPKVTLQIANSIWHHNTFSVLPDFLQTNLNYFYAPVTAMDFSDPATVTAINNWCREHTNGRIDKIIDALAPELRVALLNALYFKGTWAHEFDKKHTLADKFVLTDGSKADCQMMAVQESFSYLQTAELAAVELPYGKGHFAMTLLVPRGTQTVDQLIGRLTAAQWREWRSQFTLGNGVVEMPKIKLEYEVTLNSILNNLGMVVAFKADQADFTGISQMERLFISLVKQKTFLKVDEEGTEAAAVTFIGLGATSVGSSPEFFIRADRPFVMVLHDHATDSILFIGKILKPDF